MINGDGEASKDHREALKIDDKALKCKEQWRSVQCEEEALKGDRKAFNCNKEALN